MPHIAAYHPFRFCQLSCLASASRGSTYDACIRRVLIQHPFLLVCSFSIKTMVAHCLNCNHCKCADWLTVPLLVFSSDVVHELKILVGNMQGRSAAEGLLRASKGFVWLLIIYATYHEPVYISPSHPPYRTRCPTCIA